MTVAKGSTSAYVSLSGCLVSERVLSVVAERRPQRAFSARLHYTAHPSRRRPRARTSTSSSATGSSPRRRDGGARLQQRLARGVRRHPSSARFAASGSDRRRGVRRLPRADAARSTAARGRRAHPRAASRRGVITRALPDADTIAFSPPFVVTEAELDEMVGRARAAADEVAAELRSVRTCMGLER